MNTSIKTISVGKKKAEIIIKQDTTYGTVYNTLHLQAAGGEWTDNYGNRYAMNADNKIMVQG